MNKKVIITIEKDRHAPGVKEGKEFTAVDYSASSYGGGSPCDSPEEVKAAVRRAKETIRNEGYTPLVDNRIETKTLGAWI